MKYKLNKTGIKGRKKWILIAGIPLLLAGSGLAYWQANKNDTKPEKAAETTDEGINLNPPTNEELKQTEEHKKDLGNQTSQPSKPSGKSVKPVITSSGIYDGNVEVGSRVPGAFENNGTCTLTLTKGGQNVTKSQKATQNVSEMSCGFISISTTRLSPGDWKATVSYSSSKYNGVSDATTIRVP